MNFQAVQELKVAHSNGPIRVSSPFSLINLNTETDLASETLWGC